jgi:hypothetical protein
MVLTCPSHTSWSYTSPVESDFCVCSLKKTCLLSEVNAPAVITPLLFGAKLGIVGTGAMDVVPKGVRNISLPSTITTYSCP